MRESVLELEHVHKAIMEMTPGGVLASGKRQIGGGGSDGESEGCRKSIIVLRAAAQALIQSPHTRI